MSSHRFSPRNTDIAFGAAKKYVLQVLDLALVRVRAGRSRDRGRCARLSARCDVFDDTVLRLWEQGCEDDESGHLCLS